VIRVFREIQVLEVPMEILVQWDRLDHREMQDQLAHKVIAQQKID
jgi:hypothetical protein